MFVDLFSKQAKKYLSDRPNYPASLFTFLRTFAPNPSASCWDVGCGNGQAARGLSQVFSTVYASEPSANMLELAIKTGTPEGCGQISYSLASSEDPLPSHGVPYGTIDVISIAQAIHW
jgi:ubiquinone/menaquinone biosynthesis C-methylase UbiE